MSVNHFNTLLNQLDLSTHIAHLKNFFSREQDLYIEGDQERHFRYISALDKLEFKAPSKIEPFETSINHLKKQGVLRFEQVFEIIKVVRYFRQLKNSEFECIIGEWMDKIQIPLSFEEVDKYFDIEGIFNESLDEELTRLSGRITQIKQDMNAALKRVLYSSKVSPYLVDTQVHYVNDEEALLVRGGFNHVLKGAIIGRSTAGFFYVAPDILMKSRDQVRAITQEKEARFYEYAKSFSLLLKEMLPFIGFIDKEFNRFDHYQARVMFARAKNYQMLQAQKDDKIIIEGFEHPALQKAKPISVDFSANVLMITGVNAGGKTMLLKSILAASFMAKYIIPMKINVNKSHVGSFKRFEAVIDDPRNVKNDISTFAGRMVQFSKLFAHRSALVGVDEIELGTDSDEAAALFKGILDELITKGQKIVVTTHHKRLAALMADRDDVELMAAVYDEEARLPTYEFLQGIIGKSYAFETALRYGISNNIVADAKVIYDENHEKLNQLIERGSQLERDLKRKNSELDEKLKKVKQRESELIEAKVALDVTLENEKKILKSSYQEAINLAKKAAKGEDTAMIHRQMNAAKKELPIEEKRPDTPVVPELKVGDSVKYRRGRGHILSIKGNQATIEVEGMRMRVKKRDLKFSGNEKVATPKTQVKVQKEKRAGLKLDLHGMRAEEAIEKMDIFLSDALIAGWDEVIIYHGIGTGKLSYAVKNFLLAHPSVKGFDDAPPHFGGFGAKVVKL